MTGTEAINRGYNLMITAFLALGGIAFGTVIVEEAELPDKIDDAGFLLLGVIAVIWYLTTTKTKRSIVPVILAAAAVVVQIVGVIIEASDEKAFGDNIGGIFLFIPLLGLALLQYFYFNPRLTSGT
jgi:predicted membrane channel-forming protein YqfA (hemolysin III family)